MSFRDDTIENFKKSNNYDLWFPIMQSAINKLSMD